MFVMHLIEAFGKGIAASVYQKEDSSTMHLRKNQITLFAAIVLAVPAAFADGPSGVRFTGKIDMVPAGAGAGNWTIAGRTVVVTRDTEIETESGPAVAGACVDVKGAAGSGTAVNASSITTRPAAKCGAAATAMVEIFGAVEQLPATGVAGDWKVAGTVVRVSAQTRIDQDGGPLAVGACVEVKGTRNSDGSIGASEIEVASGIGGCRAGGGREPLSFRGTVQTAPAAGSVVWTIAGRKVTVNGGTQITPGGRLAAGSCVDVQGQLQSDNTVTASRVQVLGSGVCSNGLDRQADVAFTGRITTLPVGGLAGTWNVSGLLVTVTGETRLEAEDGGAVVVGACVEVKGEFGAGNTVRATRIETRPAGMCQGATGAFRFDGAIETLPLTGSVAGNWKIGGRTVVADGATVLDTAKGVAAIGACTSVTGALQADGSVRATRIEVLSSSGSCILTGGVVGAGNLSGAGVAAGEIVSIFGQQIGPATVLPLEVVNGQVSNRLGNTRVLFDGTPATLLFVSNGQINAIVPCNVAGKTSVKVQVESNGAWTNVVTVPVYPTYPSLFTQSASGVGPGAILNFTSPVGYSLNTAGNAAARGGTVVLFGTGEGQTTPACADGALTSLTGPFPVPVAPVTVEVGGKAATVAYAGGAPGLVRGLFQVNVVLAADTPVGPAVPVVVKIGARGSQAGVTMAVK